MMFCILSGVSPKTERNVRGAWAETMGRDLEGTGKEWDREGTIRLTRSHTRSTRVERDYRGGETGARARASGQNEIET